MSNYDERLRQIIEEMRASALVAGQYSVEEPDFSDALIAAREAKQCSKWADDLESVVREATEKEKL